MRGLTHRAVDEAAGLPTGSTSNLFRSRDDLLDGIAERFAERERAAFEASCAGSTLTPEDLGRTLGRFAVESTRSNRSLSIARYTLLVEGAIRPALQTTLREGGAAVNAWALQWFRAIRSPHPERDLVVCGQLRHGPGPARAGAPDRRLRPDPTHHRAHQDSCGGDMKDQADLTRAERLAFIDTLTTLTDEQWHTPSLCAGWTVENVAAHLAWAPAAGPLEMLPATVRAAGFRPNRLIADSAVRWTSRGRPRDPRPAAPQRGVGGQPLGVPRIAALTDAVVHGLDVRVPLGLAHDIDPDAFRLIADWTVTTKWPSTMVIGGSPASRLRGTRLVASDLDWSWGEGTEVRETSDRILLRLLGRDPVGAGPTATRG